MNRRISIPFLSFVLLSLSVATAFSQINTNPKTTTDTPVVNIAKEDALINEVVKSKAIPKQDKVQYVSQVTKYGFKNLFSNYDYYPSMPYTAQVNPNAENFIQDYMKSHGNYLQRMKGWGRPYFTLIENILQQYGLPYELKYIAVIESSLKTSAISNKGACGPWQLMPGTARRLGLTISPYVDERTDYYKSTNAAARYLLTLYAQFHDWLLVMAAYNGGTGTVLSAIQKSHSRDFWRLQMYLPEESRLYVKRFIATHYIMEGTGGVTTTPNNGIGTDSSGNYYDNTNEVTRTSYRQISGFNPYNKKSNLSPQEKINVQQLNISGKYYSSVIAKNLAMDIADFNHYNPAFDNVLSGTGNYNLQLPPDKMNLFVTNKYQILNESVQVLLGGLTIPDSKTVYAKKHFPPKN
jgi:membrane-bound lytic murein transglycosylase D